MDGHDRHDRLLGGHKGDRVWTGVDDEEYLAAGIRDAYQQGNLRYSQMAPLNMYQEANTGSNLPAQIEIYADQGDTYDFLFIAKGGGSANKTFLMQETKSVLNPEGLAKLLGDVGEARARGAAGSRAALDIRSPG